MAPEQRREGCSPVRTPLARLSSDVDRPRDRRERYWIGVAPAGAVVSVIARAATCTAW
jgi:hypothetical protein